MARAVPKDIGLVKLIENANPAYNRYKLGDIDALAKDIGKRGLDVPILITPGYQIIDGARRFEAIKKLGWDWVPTRITDEFYGAIAGITAARDQGSPFELRPGWLEIDNLVRFTLVPLYAPIKREHMARGAKQARAGFASSRTRSRGSDLTDAVAAALGLSPGQLEQIRRLGALVQQSPTSVREHMRAIVDEREPTPDSSRPCRGLQRTYNTLEQIRDNWRQTGTLDPPPPTYLDATEQLTRLTRICQMLGGVIREVKDLGLINPDFPKEEVPAIKTALYNASATFGAMRTQLLKLAEENEKG